MSVRAAARSGTDTHFDWNDRTTYVSALEGVDRDYLVPPGNSLDFADQVGEFLDVAESVDVEHVTYLSARAVEGARPEVALRAVELKLAERPALSLTVLRPAWFIAAANRRTMHRDRQGEPCRDHALTPPAAATAHWENLPRSDHVDTSRCSTAPRLRPPQLGVR